MPRHFVDLLELTTAEAERLIGQSLQLKRDEKRGRDRPPLLSGRTLGLMFEKPSLRTRVSFEAAIARLGGNAIFLRSEDVGLGNRESVSDFRGCSASTSTPWPCGRSRTPQSKSWRGMP